MHLPDAAWAGNFQTENWADVGRCQTGAAVSLAHGSEIKGTKARRTAPLLGRRAPGGETVSARLTVWCGREDSNFHGR